MSDPRQYSFVKFNYDSFPDGFKDSMRNAYPFAEKKRYIFLGEIPNLPRHCIVMDSGGKMYTGYHTENFVEIAEDDLDKFLP